MSCFGDTLAITIGSSNEIWLTQCEVYARVTPSCVAATTSTPLAACPRARLSLGSIMDASCPRVGGRVAS